MREQIDIEGKTETEVLEILSSFQKALESEKLYHDTLDNMMEGFQIIGFDWKYLYVNNTVVRQSKFSREELINRTMMEMYPGIENTPMFQALRLCMNARVTKQFENEFKYPDGSSGWFELSIQPVQEGLLILSIDITHRKKAEKEKREYIKGLEEMIFMTSHKLRQPVTHILGIANILNHCSNSEEELIKIAGYIKKSALDLDTFSKELTEFIHALEQKAKE